MIESPGVLLTVLAFLAVIGPLVFLHELGHYWAGRWFGVKAEAFSIGFGREVAGWTDARGTRWKVGWLPLGGYVRFAGDMNPASQPSPEWLALPAAERAQTFQAKPLWQRALIVLAGPVANFLIAIIILAGFALAFGEPRNAPTIATVVPGGVAASAGLQPGDEIRSIGGRRTDRFNDIARYVRLRPGETVVIDYVRDGVSLRTSATIAAAEESDGFGNSFRVGRLGIGGGIARFEAISPLDAPAVAVRQTVSIVQDMVAGIAQIVTGRRSVKELGGPLKIAEISGQQAVLGIAPFVFLIALISINLGFINLLPIPMLDGGHLLFYAIEGVTRRPVDPRAMEWAFRGGLTALLALMVMVTINDLGSWGVWNRIAGLIG